jgi:nitroreductase
MGLTRRNDELKEVLCVPGSLKIIAMTPLGYPDESPGPKDRKSLDQIVSWGQYGKGGD